MCAWRWAARGMYLSRARWFYYDADWEEVLNVKNWRFMGGGGLCCESRGTWEGGSEGRERFNVGVISEIVKLEGNENDLMAHYLYVERSEQTLWTYSFKNTFWTVVVETMYNKWKFYNRKYRHVEVWKPDCCFLRKKLLLSFEPKKLILMARDRAIHLIEIVGRQRA